MAADSVNTPSEASSVASVAAAADDHKRKIEDSEANSAPEAVIESDESLKNGSQEEGGGGVDESDAKRPRLESSGDNFDEADACGDSSVPRNVHTEEKEEDEPKLLSEQAAEGQETGPDDNEKTDVASAKEEVKANEVTEEPLNIPKEGDVPVDYAEREPHSYTQILSCKMEVPSNKNSSTNLSSLPEDESQNGAQSDSKLPSALSSKPDRRPTQIRSKKYTPLDWSDYFDQEDDVRIPDSDNVFHIYKAGNEGPVLLCLHGPGYSGLWFALSAKEIKKKARVVALDLRGHGKSTTDNDSDLTMETLCNDVVAVMKTMYGDSPPAIVIIGHSMGGALAVHISVNKELPSLAGVVVVDIVEDIVMGSLTFAQRLLLNPMHNFSTIEKAMELDIKGVSLDSIDCACVYIRSPLVYDDSRKCYTHPAKLEEIEQHWRECYEGLSKKFLSSPVPKLLLSAGTDRLDKTLTIDQMQGKFQMMVLQEDGPDELSNLVFTFISQYRIGPRGVEPPPQAPRSNLGPSREQKPPSSTHEPSPQGNYNPTEPAAYGGGAQAQAAYPRSGGEQSGYAQPTPAQPTYDQSGGYENLTEAAARPQYDSSEEDSSVELWVESRGSKDIL